MKKVAGEPGPEDIAAREVIFKSYRIEIDKHHLSLRRTEIASRWICWTTINSLMAQAVKKLRTGAFRNTRRYGDRPRGL